MLSRWRKEGRDGVLKGHAPRIAPGPRRELQQLQALEREHDWTLGTDAEALGNPREVRRRVVDTDPYDFCSTGRPRAFATTSAKPCQAGWARDGPRRAREWQILRHGIGAGDRRPLARGIHVAYALMRPPGVQARRGP